MYQLLLITATLNCPCDILSYKVLLLLRNISMGSAFPPVATYSSTQPTYNRDIDVRGQL